MKESDLLEEDFPLPQKEEKTEELQDDIENLNLNEYLKAKDIDVSEGAGIQNKVSLKEREQKKDPEKKPGLRMIARNKVDEMKPEDFLLHKDAYSLSDKRVRKGKIKRFLLDRALIRYNYRPDNEYDKDRESYYQDYLENPNVAHNIESFFRWAWFKYDRLFKYEMPQVTPHICRHTFATALYIRGVNVKTAQYLLGHGDVSTTLRIYTDTNAEAAHKDCEEHPEVFTNFDDIWGKIEEEED